MIGGGLVVANSTTGPAAPADTVFRYYDASYLRQLDAAYALLDPAQRPDRATFATERSVLNGLVASYVRLDRVDTVDVRIDDDTATVESELVYLTALEEHRVMVSDTLRRIGGRWVIEPHPIDISIPPDQLVSRPTLDYLVQGRRQVTSGGTAYQDVIDRPELRILASRLVRHNGQLSVVGEVRNDDVDPGYVTVSAELVDEFGETITEYAGPQRPEPSTRRFRARSCPSGSISKASPGSWPQTATRRCRGPRACRSRRVPGPRWRSTPIESPRSG